MKILPQKAVFVRLSGIAHNIIHYSSQPFKLHSKQTFTDTGNLCSIWTLFVMYIILFVRMGLGV